MYVMVYAMYQSMPVLSFFVVLIGYFTAVVVGLIRFVMGMIKKNTNE